MGRFPVSNFRQNTRVAPTFAGSAFIAGIVVSLMAIPMVTSLSRRGVL